MPAANAGIFLSKTPKQPTAFSQTITGFYTCSYTQKYITKLRANKETKNTPKHSATSVPSMAETQYCSSFCGLT